MCRNDAGKNVVRPEFKAALKKVGKGIIPFKTNHPASFKVPFQV